MKATLLLVFYWSAGGVHSQSIPMQSYELCEREKPRLVQENTLKPGVGHFFIVGSCAKTEE